MLRMEPLQRAFAWVESKSRRPLPSATRLTEFDAIRTFWIGEKLPTFHRMCVQSWLDLGYAVEFYAYAPVDNVPDGAQMRDANEIMPRADILEGGASLSQRAANLADVFRMALLAADKGPWCDADYLMLRPLPTARDILVGRETSGHLCNAILWAPPAHDMMPRVIATFRTHRLERWSYANAYVETLKRRVRRAPRDHAMHSHHHWGRHAVTYFVARDGLEDQVQPPEAFFYPVIYDEKMYRGENAFDHIIDDVNVRGLHFFFKPEDLVLAAEAGSFIDWAKKRFLR